MTGFWMMGLCWAFAMLTVEFGVNPNLIGQDTGQQDKPAQESKKEAEQDEQRGETAETTEEKMDRARDHAANEEYDKAIAIIDELLKEDTANNGAKTLLVRLLDLRARELYEHNRRAANSYVIRAAGVIRQLVESQNGNARLKSRLSSYIYAEARCYAFDGKIDQALASLKEAFEWGFDEIEMATSDADLKSLADNKDFHNLIEKTKLLIAKRLTEEAKAQLAVFESYDFDFELDDLDGNKVSLADYRGKVLIVDFWGTWCRPCRAVIPSFVKLKEAFGQQGLDIVGLTYEHGDDEEEKIQGVREFMEEFKINYKCLMGDEATRNQIPQFGGYPTTLFIDHQGKVRLELVGSNRFGKLHAVIQELLTEKVDD